MKKRFIGIDWGGKRVGIALGDPLGLCAHPYKVFLRNGAPKSSCQKLWALIEKDGPFEAIILGYPLELSGKEGASAKEVVEVKALLEELSGLTVYLIDERMTSKIATRGLISEGLSRKARGPLEDARAAALILQTFLDKENPSALF